MANEQGEIDPTSSESYTPNPGPLQSEVGTSELDEAATKAINHELKHIEDPPYPPELRQN